MPDQPQNSSDHGCEEVDFLFVIDDSIGMEDAQAKLQASAPAFIETVRGLLDYVDRFHVGVITSDAYVGNAPECSALGDMVTQTGGMGALGEICSFDEGHRFATEVDDLSAAFSCMAQVGTGGSPLEQPVTATIAALERSLERGSCNEGFFGDGSVVVIVVVTDDIPSELELDDANLGAPGAPSWAMTVSSIVHTYDTAAITIGLVPWGDTSCTGAQSPNLINFVESFNGWDWGVLGSVCEPDYGVVFDQALWAVENACDSLSDQNCGGCPME